MKLLIAGGVGEHGRNCFYVQTKTLCFLVDCGKMADTPETPYPRLSPEEIRHADAVFLTHSHADHTGALPWLYENGFHGATVAAAETLGQLPFAAEDSRALQTVCPDGRGHFQGLSIQWGRSGHCAGSVWYRFAESGKAIFFSGDYTEDTQVYACDPIRDQQADLAILDCAYGPDETSYAASCGRLVRETERLLSAHGLLLFPVPKYGRGLELLRLLSDRLKGVPVYADALFLQNLVEWQAGGFWYRPSDIPPLVQPYRGQAQGIVFVSDPQLRSEEAQRIAGQMLATGGSAVMTGTIEKGSFSECLLKQGKMTLLRYPVHLNCAQFNRLKAANVFAQAIPYHSPALPGAHEVLF